ncbi:MAG: YbjQ family protein [Gemmatimonadota bacterium]
MSPVQKYETPYATTGLEFPGYRVVRTLGVVRGITVRSRSVLGVIGVKFQAFFGGNITLLVNLCEQARMDAFQIMISHGGELGGNAIIGLRYDATELMPGITEVLCYGTAVYIEPV